MCLVVLSDVGFMNQMAEKKRIKVKTVCCVSAEIVFYNLNCAQKEIVIKVMSAT